MNTKYHSMEAQIVTVRRLIKAHTSDSPVSGGM
jgi:hypothetical protein